MFSAMPLLINSRYAKTVPRNTPRFRFFKLSKTITFTEKLMLLGVRGSASDIRQPLSRFTACILIKKYAKPRFNSQLFLQVFWQRQFMKVV